LIYVVTVHHQSGRWVDVQRSYLERHMSEPYQVWANLAGVEHLEASVDRMVPAVGPHAGKLNLIAAEVVAEAASEDLLMFMDGDAFPIADPMPAVRDALSSADLVAVRRDENLSDPQPHPSFAVTSVAAWTAISGDWSPGHPWPSIRAGQSQLASDVGGNLLRLLALHDRSWHPLLRSNRTNLHPLWYGIYGDIVYHHGAGFRSAVSRWDMQNEPRGLRASHRKYIGAPLRPINRARRSRWRRQVTQQQLRQSDEIYAAIRSDFEFYRRFL
jgi:hypothetical protein